MTIPAQEQASYDLFVQVKNLLTSLSEFIEGTPGVTAEDREALQTRWKSRVIMQQGLSSTLGLSARAVRATSYSSRPTSVVSRLIKVNDMFKRVCIVALTLHHIHLLQSFEALSDEICGDLNQTATSGLERKCRDSAKLVRLLLL